MIDHIHQWEGNICKICKFETEQCMDCKRIQYLVYGYGGVICAFCYEERYRK